MSFRPLMIRYGVQFRTILFPLRFLELVNVLEKKGYEISPSLPSPPPPQRMSGAGEIARKGKAVLQIDTSGQGLRVADVSLASAIQSFEEIAAMLAEDYDIDINEFARFYDLHAVYTVPTKKRPYEAISKALRSPIFDDLAKVLEEKIWPFALRFGGADLVVNSENWFDITVRPDYEREDSYIFEIVFRNNDRIKTREFARKFEKRVPEIIRVIEG